ncbi:hypothetical protein E3E51_10000 [Thermococcus sp. 21S7]|nr:hypothetical protein [Thermococcus sp. 21S7]
MYQYNSTRKFKPSLGTQTFQVNDSEIRIRITTKELRIVL